MSVIDRLGAPVRAIQSWMSGADRPIDAARVLDDERQALGGAPVAAAAGGDAPPDPLAAAIERHRAATLSALCLSGGGIRSASFSLGVLQGLARAGTLASFDYLSTVSGGGYIGGWLSAWRQHAREAGELDAVVDLGGRPVEPQDPEPKPVTRVRRYIRFLDPRLGLFSVDVWTLATIIARNLILNWLVLLPFLAALALAPRLYLGVLGLPSQPELVPPAVLEAWYARDWIVITVLFGTAALYAALELPSLGHRGHGQRSFLAWFLAPVLLAELILSMHRYWEWRFGDPVAFWSAIVFSMIGMALPWILGGFLVRRWRPLTVVAAALAGAAGRAFIWTTSTGLSDMARERPELFATLDIPVTLAIIALEIALFVGLASSDMDDEDREWWSRAGAWLLIVAAAWLAACALVFYGPLLLLRLYASLGVEETTGHWTAALAALLSGGAASRLATSSAATAWPRLRRGLVAVAGPSVVALVFVLVANANFHLLVAVHRLGLVRQHTHPIGASLPEDLVLIAGLLLTGAVLGLLISCNDFSLHGMYRLRLVRTFLGASRPRRTRRPSPFTGFDGADDVSLASLAANGRPLHVLNATLNVVESNRIAMQERKSESFTMSPLHAGTRRTGYRPAAAYAGAVSLGNAMTISGAAVSPNMGAASSPTLTFLLALFNARLGAWLGNPGTAGAATWRRPRPGSGVAPLISEMLGRTSDASPYIYLSDGGHFENLGLYEMIFRRCRFIVVVDGGCDPDYTFQDLAGAVRKAREDFGIDITFPDGLHIGGPGAAGPRAHHAVGVIQYSAVHPGAPDGVLVYIKATLTGDEPVDVTNHARAHPQFPHDSTANQWFDDARFESYRMLGVHSVLSVLGGVERAEGVGGLCAAAARSAQA